MVGERFSMNNLYVSLPCTDNRQWTAIIVLSIMLLLLIILFIVL